MFLVLYTQYQENYSDDAARPHWKCKGGSTYLVQEISVQDAATLAHDGLRKLIDAARARLINNDMAQESIIDWALLDALPEDAEKFAA